MKLLYSFLKDLRLAFKSYYIYLELFIVLLFVAVLLFVVPENLGSRVNVYTWSEAPGITAERLERSLKDEGLILVALDSEEELAARIREDKASIGIKVTVQEGRPRITFILQGYENEKLRNTLRVSVESSFASASPRYEEATTVSTLQADPEVLSDRVNMLPVFLTMNAAFMGLFIIAAYVFLDKEEGTIKAFAVTPARVWHYLAGKMGVIMVTGFLSGFLAVILIAGEKAHYLHLLALLLSTNAFGTALGLFIASFFDDMTSAMGWLYVSVMVLGVSSVSYYMPSFSPLPIRLLPSYPMLFAYRELLLRSPNLGYVYANVAGFAIAGVFIFLLANRQFKRNLTA